MPIGHPKMFKRPSYFKHGCYNSIPPSPESIARLLVDRSPTHGVIPPPPPPPTKKILYTKDYDWLRARSELTPEQRMDPNFLRSVGLLIHDEPEQKPYVERKEKEKEFSWSGGIKCVFKVEGDYVRFHIDTKMMDIQKNYFDKAKRPPLRKYVEALQSFGYSNEKVNKVIDRHIWLKTHKKEMQAEFDRLWPPEKKKMSVKKALKAVIKH